MNAAPALTNLLKEVSRSFYLTLRVLPSRIRPQIGLAYLLALATDTIADTDLVPTEKRIEALKELRERIASGSTTGQALKLDLFARQQHASAERSLLEQSQELLNSLNSLSVDDRERVANVLGIITSGQELDLLRFAHASSEKVVALETDEELDDYTYRVAGCVGDFWTRMCRAHLFPNDALDDAFLIANGVRFGKGLQLVNILRDIPSDLRQGRCYLPKQKLTACELAPDDLLNPTNEPRFRELYDSFLARAEDHLRAGWRYTNTLPRRCIRVRLACAWPILIGLETLSLLRTHNPLDPDQRIKVSRDAVKKLLFRSVLVYPFPETWKRMVPSSQVM